MIGTGYVGLVTGVCFAELGHDVTCVDKVANKIEMLGRGELPIYEPGLDELVARNLASGRLRFSGDLAGSVKHRDAIFICVGTPSDQSGRADLEQVFAAAAEAAVSIDQFCVLVTKSTVPVGTNRRMLDFVNARLQPGVRVAVASNPEFLREGAAIRDFMEPDRVVIGAEDAQAAQIMRAIYAPLLGPTTPLVETGLETAELIKYAANAFLAVKLSFINEMADLSEALGADIEEVALGIGLDKRIGTAFLKVGPGWGGSCLPKDTNALQVIAQDAGAPSRIIAAAVDANEDRKRRMAERVVRATGGEINGRKVAVWGVTFKGQTDDMRESPALEILPALSELGARVHAYDPSHPRDAAALLPTVAMEPDPISAAHGADVLVIAAEWREFRTYDLAAIAAVMQDPVMVDLRNLFREGDVLRAGFRRYHSLGISAREASPAGAAAMLAGRG